MKASAQDVLPTFIHKTNKAYTIKIYALFTSGRQDSNLRPPGPKPGALPDCATPRNQTISDLRVQR